MSIPSLGSQTLHFDPQTNAFQTNPHVGAVQQALNQLAGASLVPETGVFDAATRDALREFQQLRNIPGNGVINQQTIDVLNQLRRQPAQDTRPSSPPAVIPEADRNQRTQELRNQGTAVRANLDQLVSQNQQFFENEAARRTSVIPQTERPAFDRIEAANNLTEGGGRGAVRSRLGTTAGEPASIGRGQLLTQLQIRATAGLARDRRIGAEFQQRTGIDPQALNTVNNRGRAAMAWHDLIASNRGANGGPKMQEILNATGLSQIEANQIRTAARDGRMQDILGNPDFVQRFRDRTGLPAEDLRTITNSRGLQTGAYSDEFRRARAELAPQYRQEVERLTNELRSQYQTAQRNYAREPRARQTALNDLIQANPIMQRLASEPGLRNNPGRLFRETAMMQLARDPAHPELHHLSSVSGLQLPELARQGAAGRVALSHPDLQELLQANRSNRNRLGMSDTAFYLQNGRVGENRNGWYTRGAMSARNEWNTIERNLPNIDIITNRQRSIDNFQAARRIAGGIQGFNLLPAPDQERIIGQIARVHHFGGQAVQTHFGANAPHTLDQYNQWLNRLQSAPGNSGSHQLWIAIDRWTNNYNRLGVQAGPAQAD